MPAHSELEQDADWLVQMLVDFNSIPAAEFHARYPQYLSDREKLIADGWKGWEAAFRVVIDYAQNIAAARAGSEG